MDEIKAFVLSHIKEIQAQFKKSEIRTYAASTGFCMLMSVLPALMIISSILPHTSVTEADLVGFLLSVFPQSSDELIRQICDQAYGAAGGILPVSIIIMLWSAGFGMLQLNKALNTINEVEEKRNYFLLRLVGTLYMLLIMALVIALLLFQIFANQLVDLWESIVPYVEPPEVFTSAMRYIVLFAFTIILFELLFTTMPATSERKPLEQLPGAIVAACGWEVLSILFTIYARLAPHLNNYYGSLTTFLVLMFWIYWCLYIMLFGAFVNRFIKLYVLPVWNNRGKEKKQPAEEGR